MDTERLALRAATLALAIADHEDRSRFVELLDAEVPASWPPELYDDDAKRATIRGAQDDGAGLSTYYVLLKRGENRPLLIGTAGFKHTPTVDTSEIGYSIVQEWHGRGLGTEVVHALTSHAFKDKKVGSVCAHTFEHLIASRRVLEKNGFVLRGTPAEQGTIRYELMRTDWERQSAGPAKSSRAR